MAGSDGIHWVRTSADIPSNDFLNFTVEELGEKFPKVPRRDLILERHMRFPRKYPIPPELRGRDPQYRKTPFVRSLSDLRDSIFQERTSQDIMEQYPQFTPQEILSEKTARDVGALMERISSNLRNPSPETLERARAAIRNALGKLDSAGPLTPGLDEMKLKLVEIEQNLSSRKK
jgi:hypothetical protein